MGRILGVDLGQSRTGFALSDPVGISCSPLRVVHERDRKALLRIVLELAEQEAVEEIVVGIPRPLSGGANEQSREAESFAGELARAADRKVVQWDERFTTKLAERDRRHGPADDVAACYLLQNYLDSRRTGTFGREAEPR